MTAWELKQAQGAGRRAWQREVVAASRNQRNVAVLRRALRNEAERLRKLGP